MLKFKERELVSDIRPAVAYGKGRAGRKVKYVVIHVAEAPAMSNVINWFTNPACPVSAHYGVDRDGKLYQFVSEADTGYHAANRIMNYESIGIEHAGYSGRPFSKEQIQVSAQLTARICRGYGIPLENIIRHSEIKGTTHAGCPGPTWDMGAYRKLVKYYIEEYNKG